MKIDDVAQKYPILKPVVKRIKEVDGVEELFPPQAEAVKSGYLDGKNILLALATGSGKTLIAELAMLKTILEKRKKAIYLVPLKALATEKYQEFKKKYEPLGIKVAISIGDFDSADGWLASYDIIVASNERLDSLMRHGIPWIHDLGIIISDEIHLLDSPERGPTLEVTLTKLKQLTDAQFLGLSATVNNYKEIAAWLESKPIKSNFRPVKLYKGVCYDQEVHFIPKKTMKLHSSNPLFELVENVLKKGKQVLVFVNTRRSTESSAEKIGEHIEKALSPEERKQLTDLSNKIRRTLENHTKQCNRLADCITKGTAFHHAGLVASQRGLIEKSFKKGIIKVITATPTLSFGLNCPAHTAIIRDLKRFSSYRGMDYLPVLEILQMCGRAGRIKYDTEGFGILLPKNKSEAQYAWKNYIKGKPEDIKSKLGVEPVLRTHVLALIASGMTPTKKSLLDFFFKTFYAHQYKDLTNLEKILDKILRLLAEFEFITGVEKTDKENPFQKASSFLEKDKRLGATLIGKRVSELYLDPLTANHVIESLKKSKASLSHFALLQLISHTREMFPLISLRKNDFEVINELLIKEESNLLEKPPNEWDLEYDDYLKSIKTALVFSKWSEEWGEDKLLESYGITPGELRVRLNNADWLLYATQELALLLGFKNILKDIRKSRLRVKYGIREELLPLIKLKGVGRVRARNLFNNNLKTLDSLRKIPVQSLELIIGPKTAREIKEQL